LHSDQLFDVLRRFASTMARRFEIGDVLQQVADHAVAVLDAVGAGVSVAGPGNRLRFVTATSERITAIERVQDEHQAGVCVEAFRTGRTVAMSTSSELRWRHYRAAIEAAGLGAVAGFPLSVGDRRIGSLNVYDVEGREWTSGDLAAAQVLADVSSAYVLHAGELAEARQMGAQLQQALDSRVVIEQAKGMLSRDHGIPVDDAFEILRRHARASSAGLREVAEQIVHDGLRLPARPEHR
jgi:GAF domain-containing protein